MIFGLKVSQLTPVSPTFLTIFSYDLLNSRTLPCEGLRFWCSFKTHCYFTARCTLIAHLTEPLLSRIT